MEKTDAAFEVVRIKKGWYLSRIHGQTRKSTGMLVRERKSKADDNPYLITEEGLHEYFISSQLPILRKMKPGMKLHLKKEDVIGDKIPKQSQL